MENEEKQVESNPEDEAVAEYAVAVYDIFTQLNEERLGAKNDDTQKT